MAIIGALPVVLTNGTVADATQVMADFNYILSQVNANAVGAVGGVLTGPITVPPPLIINGAAGTVRSLITQTAGSNRWSLATNGTAESGSNAGSDFQINRFNDAGVTIDTPLLINRATGLVTINSLSSPSLGSMRNFLFNPLFNVQQRSVQGVLGIPVAAISAPYTFDRWYVLANANQASVVASSAAQFTGAVGPYFASITRNSGQTGIGNMWFAQAFDTDVIQLLAGQQVTATVQFNVGANFSATSVSLNLVAGTGAPTRTSTGFTGSTTVLSVSASPNGANIVTLSATGTVPGTTRQLEFRVFWSPVGTAGAADTINVFLPRLNLGPVDLGPDLTRIYTTELPICQRFYQKSFSPAIAPAQNAGTTDAVWVRSQVAAATFGQWIAFNGMAGMRIVPTVVTYNPSVANANWRDIVASADRTVQVQAAGFKGIMIEGLAGTAGGANLIHWTADAEIM